MCANSEGSGETARMRRLAYVISTIILWAGSFEVLQRNPECDMNMDATGTVESGYIAWPFMLHTVHSEPAWLYLWS